ncbi:conserved hypothetical protein [Thiomonas sp. CB2]|nr:conserved hypothetical protein [Thiomonas sp. CB2]CQR41788.1 conserved hypothetical protein [Thiomonas sp. CB3]VDY03741.1 conserved protein of unknown function [Thiomonas sp. Bio17B3]VDY09082.1 conserved protein of unknown function [Thiomonas sp. Sup16B3]VDY11991.1 hypothetical protein TOC7_10513 [Thiomonas sp. OC7]
MAPPLIHTRRFTTLEFRLQQRTLLMQAGRSLDGLRAVAAAAQNGHLIYINSEFGVGGISTATDIPKALLPHR